jgi:hypothetical protein
MGAPREVSICGWAVPKSDDAHAHYATAKHFLFHIYRPTSRHQRVVCLCMWLVIDKDDSDTEVDSGTDTEGVESFVPNSVSLLCRKVNWFFYVQCSIKFHFCWLLVVRP